MTREPAWAERHTLTAVDAPELTDSFGNVLPVALQMAKEAEAVCEVELEA
jgi:hypothetical protein